MLVGLSRTGKTPLSVYLALEGWRVGNVPLVKGQKVPTQVLDLPRDRVVGLAIDPRRLAEIRRARMEYIAPGIIMMAIITNSYANVVSSFFGAKYQRHIEEILIAPVPSGLILAGYVCGGLIRGLLVGVLVTLVALLFTDLSIRHVGVTCGVVVLTATLFSTAGLINAIFAQKFDDISIVPTFILTPLVSIVLSQLTG